VCADACDTSWWRSWSVCIGCAVTGMIAAGARTRVVAPLGSDWRIRAVSDLAIAAIRHRVIALCDFRRYRTVGIMRSRPSLFVGVGVPLALYPFTGWWLNSREAMRVTLPVLFGVAVLVGDCWEHAVWLWLGVMVAMTALLGWLDPGNIWPIVLVVAGVLAAGAIGTGSLVGSGFRRAFNWMFHS
jgi:hypothetical protein